MICSTLHRELRATVTTLASRHTVVSTDAHLSIRHIELRVEWEY